MYTKFSRVFTKDFISGMCRDATIFFFFFRGWGGSLDDKSFNLVVLSCKLLIQWGQGFMYFLYQPYRYLRSFYVKTVWVFNSWLNRSKIVQLLKEKRLQVRKIGASGATGDLRDSILCLNRNSKFITYLWGRDHSERPLCTSTTDSNVELQRNGARKAQPHLSLKAWCGKKIRTFMATHFTRWATALRD